MRELNLLVKSLNFGSHKMVMNSATGHERGGHEYDDANQLPLAYGSQDR
jgi:hypothetical protein